MTLLSSHCMSEAQLLAYGFRCAATAQDGGNGQSSHCSPPASRPCGRRTSARSRRAPYSARTVFSASTLSILLTDMPVISAELATKAAVSAAGDLLHAPSVKLGKKVSDKTASGPFPARIRSQFLNNDFEAEPTATARTIIAIPTIRKASSNPAVSMIVPTTRAETNCPRFMKTE